MKIIIGAPIKDRAWILPEYLNVLKNIDYHNKQYLFYENHSTDDTFKILRKFAMRYTCTLHQDIEGEHVGSSRYEYSKNEYGHLANIRNKFLDYFLETDGEYLFSIDSDIIVPSNIIKELIKCIDQNTIIGAAVCNIPNGKIDGRTPGNFMQSHGEIMVHPIGYVPQGLYNVDVIGACYLIPRKVIEDGIRYAPNQQGEDIPFCRKAKEKGYRLLVNMDIRPDHRMTKEVINSGGCAL